MWNATDTFVHDHYKRVLWGCLANQRVLSELHDGVLTIVAYERNGERNDRGFSIDNNERKRESQSSVACGSIALVNRSLEW